MIVIKTFSKEVIKLKVLKRAEGSVEVEVSAVKKVVMKSFKE